MTPKFFPTQTDFRLWLEENHDKETELLVGFYKVGSGKPSMSWSHLHFLLGFYDGNDLRELWETGKRLALLSAIF